MKKKIIALVLCALIVIALVRCTASIGDVAIRTSGKFTSSKTLHEDSIVVVVLENKDGEKVEAEIVVIGPDASAAERKGFANSDKPSIMITPVSTASMVLEKSKDEKIADKNAVAEDGLTYVENEQLVKIFDIVKASTKTVKTLKIFGIKEKTVQEVIPKNAKVDDYQPAALFDVRVNEAALELMGEGGKFTVTVEVIGVKEGDEVVVISIVENDEAKVKEGAPELVGEILKAAVKEGGAVTFTASQNGPILVLVNPGK